MSTKKYAEIRSPKTFRFFQKTIHLHQRPVLIPQDEIMFISTIEGFIKRFKDSVEHWSSYIYIQVGQNHPLKF